jgi:FAD/FMN-containing dehydrogenase
MTSFETLHDAVQGAVFLPGEEEWDRARASWNLAVDQRPAAVLEAESVEDVQAAMRFATTHGLRVAPQATGHGSETLGSLEGALLLKTSRLRWVDIDSSAGVARIGPGTLASQIADAASAHRLSPVLGLAAVVGAVGFSLNGGVGWLSRRHGFGCNNVRALDVVLSNGETRHVDADSEPDLFWALRGGGGRVGIVTGLELKAHAIDELHGGAVMWPAERAGEVLEQFVSLTADAPDELTLVFRYVSIPDIDGPPPALRGRRLVALIGANLGPEPAQFAAIRALGDPVVDALGPIEPAQLVRIAGDPEQPIPARSAGFLLDTLPADAAATAAELIESQSLPALTVFELRHLGGALARGSADHGVLNSVSAHYSVFAGGGAVSAEAIASIDADNARLRERLEPWASSSTLLSAAPAGSDPSSAFDGQTWERLQAIEREYDPDRLILSNHE